jgi:hypothetical protein
VNAARRQILPAGKFWDNRDILGWDKMLRCDRQQRLITIRVTIKKGIGKGGIGNREFFHLFLSLNP